MVGCRADVEWLPPPLDHGASDELVPFTEGGPNGVRSAILLSVFANDVFVHGRSGLTRIKGRRDDPYVQDLLRDEAVERSVASRV